MVKAKAVNTNTGVTQAYKLGKPYNVRQGTAADNAASWQLVQGLVVKGPQTRAQLEQALKEQRNHASFAGYCIRRGWLVNA